MVQHNFNTSAQETEAGKSEFEANLVYRAIARARQRSPVSKNRQLFIFFIGTNYNSLRAKGWLSGKAPTLQMQRSEMHPENSQEKLPGKLVLAHHLSTIETELGRSLRLTGQPVLPNW